jgi:hypothetical protein
LNHRQGLTRVGGKRGAASGRGQQRRRRESHCPGRGCATSKRQRPGPRCQPDSDSSGSLRVRQLKCRRRLGQADRPRVRFSRPRPMPRGTWRRNARKSRNLPSRSLNFKVVSLMRSAGAMAGAGIAQRKLGRAGCVWADERASSLCAWRGKGIGWQGQTRPRGRHDRRRSSSWAQFGT